MSDVFVHDLSYVALSRATNSDNVFLLTPDDVYKVKNMVFPEVVDDLTDDFAQVEQVADDDDVDDEAYVFGL
ncbi:unnamed protein product [Ambrosiozyma monospora]|uniref:Unnamed protein product n=1 Tax=Ambrosiozyma monospora TaxID=43982 RepID=A0ACB5T2Y3_AMBMO|nr:unnamed protein product [Ambrosiozyma monospora]